MKKKVVCVFLDLETGEKSCGIIQISIEINQVELERGETATKDTLARLTWRWGFHEEFKPGRSLFNEYVNLGKDFKWNAAGAVHGLSESHPSIRSARKISNM